MALALTLTSKQIVVKIKPEGYRGVRKEKKSDILNSA